MDRRRLDSDHDRDPHKHHRSSKDKSRDAADDDRRHHSHRRSKHRDEDDDRNRSERRSSREYSVDRDKSVEPRNEERFDDRRKREKSYEREDSVEGKHTKRKERGESEEYGERDYDGGTKRTRVLEERKEKRRLEDHMNGREKEEKKERRRFEDAVEGKEGREERRERRRFEDKVKKEQEGMEVERIEGRFEERVGKKEPKDELPDNGDLGAGDSVANGGAMESFEMTSTTLPESHLYHNHSPATKVSSISTTNENKGVNINRSHEVPGKSSTDGTASDAGKLGGLSRDALDKAKRALKMQKELAEKLRKIPLLNKATGATRESTLQLGPNEGHIAPSSSSGILPTPAALVRSSSMVTSGATPNASTLPAAAAASIGLPHLPGLNHERFEAVKKAQELAAKMGFRQDPEFAPLINMFPGQMPPEVSIQPKPAKAPVLRLDALGREIDEHGNVVNVPKVNSLSTLKVNINKQKKEAFQILKPELEVDPEKNPHFDPSMGINKNKILRPKRMTFQFVEEGKWSKDAEIIKLKSQFGEARAKELKAKQAQLAKAKAEPDINPNLIEVSERVIIKEKQKETIPETEWWDVPILQSGSYGHISDGNLPMEKLKMEKITIYVEHPRPIEPPAEPTPPPPQPLKLTKKEQKKLRTQRRLAREKDKQEMIRQGLLEPPKPKVKMSNLMKVLGSEATQDPTKLEMEIRSAAAEREQAHIDRNIARKLTPAERREKKERKLFDDPDKAEIIVSVYKVNYLSHPQARFKVDANAHENRLTGCAVISDGISVVVVEGCPKSIKRYGKLMLRRIDWAAAVKNEGEDEDEDDGDTPANKCMLVWQGSVVKPSFNRFSIHECRTEAAARKIFSDAGVSHYWDLAVNFTEDQI
ncbi:protein RDM16-like isoform X1 [Coffea arabica]|uniref:Protein RDM16-like isoform X1 n=2 Tax=Coffea arabica TaxID=13443 RepID=A0ABM4WE68_COFAR